MEITAYPIILSMEEKALEYNGENRHNVLVDLSCPILMSLTVKPIKILFLILRA